MKHFIIWLFVLSTVSAMSALNNPIEIPDGSLTKKIIGRITGASDDQYYEISCRAGEVLIINVNTYSRKFAAIATVSFPSGRQDGGKGTPAFCARLDESGLYRIRIARNLMASVVNEGKFILEIIRIPAYAVPDCCPKTFPSEK